MAPARTPGTPVSPLQQKIRNGRRILRLPLKMALPAALVVAAITLCLQDQYTSEVRVLPKDPRTGGNPLGAAAATASMLGLGEADSGMAYVDILQSWRIAEGVLTRTYRFQDRAWLFGPPRKHAETLLHYLGAPRLDRGVKLLPKYLETERDSKSGLITISATTSSPELSQQLVQSACHLLEDYILHNSQTQAGAKAEFATTRLREAEMEALKAEERMKTFLMANRDYLSSADPGVRLQGGRLDAELQLRRQMVSSLAMSREQALLDEKDSTPILNVLDTGQLPQEKSKPGRGRMVAASFILVFLGTLAWQHRAWLNARLIANE